MCGTTIFTSGEWNVLVTRSQIESATGKTVDYDNTAMRNVFAMACTGDSSAFNGYIVPYCASGSVGIYTPGSTGAKRINWVIAVW